MKLHRFYTGDDFALEHYVWVNEPRLVNQWSRVLRFKPGQQLVLFDGLQHDRLYTITEFGKNAVHLELVTDFQRQLPQKKVTLCWSLLKKDKNDWVLQKATELGVSHFVPILAERSEKTGFNQERAHKILVEAAEQCGRSDVPTVRQPLLLQTALNELASKMPLLVCEQQDRTRQKPVDYEEFGLLIGPEGGWSQAEKALFTSQELGQLSLGSFTLRAETAAVAAAARLL